MKEILDLDQEIKNTKLDTNLTSDLETEIKKSQKEIENFNNEKIRELKRTGKLKTEKARIKESSINSLKEIGVEVM